MLKLDELSAGSHGEVQAVGNGAGGRRPDPEVGERPRRRRFSVEYKLRILSEAAACREFGEVGALLRREGLYSSHLSVWRRQYRAGALKGLKPKQRGPRASRDKVLHERVAQLEQENARLRRQLEEARVINEFQKKACEILDIPLKDRASSEGA